VVLVRRTRPDLLLMDWAKHRPTSVLTGRQRAMLILVAQGLANAEIAECL
jgi:DNA-binding CsgD family transcriptional regulator